MGETMEDDIYKPPQSELVSNLPPEPDFYVVSERKFLILAIATLGMYYIYWFYKHWKNQKLKYRENIWPVARSIFSVFFTHSLFNRIQGTLVASNKSFAWSPGVLATLYVVFSLISSITDRLSSQTNASVVFSLVGFVALVPMVFATYKAQQAANLACDDPAGAQNCSITPVNIFWIILGLLIWAMALLGFYVELFGLPPALMPVD